MTISEGTTVNVTKGNAFYLESFDNNTNQGITFEDETTAGATITGDRNGIKAITFKALVH